MAPWHFAAPLTLCLLLVLMEGFNASNMDPHLPLCAAGWWSPSNSFFESWCVSLMDPARGIRISIFLTVTPCTNQTYVVVLSCLPHIGRPGCVTQSTTHLTQAFDLRVGGKPVTGDPDAHSAPDFGWHSPDLGSLSADNGTISVSLVLNGVLIDAVIHARKPWPAADADWGWGPQGWLSQLGIMPIHAHLHSLAAGARFRFTNATDDEYWMGVEGTGWAAAQKTWGVLLPKAHSWGQAWAGNGSAMLLFAVAVFNDSLVSQVVAVSYRSGSVALDLRSTDPGVIFSEVVVQVLDRSVRLTVECSDWVLHVETVAPAACFSPTLVGPGPGSVWQPQMQSCLGARTRAQLSKQTCWGIWSAPIAFENITMEQAALHFGGTFLDDLGPLTLTL